MNNTILEIDRTDHGDTRLVTEDAAPLAEGQVRLRIDRFALTANNITYAVAGDLLGYWDFFPAEDGWGRVPAMGWADVVESENEQVPVGGRYYGWFPMAQFVTFDATASSDGFRDDGEHRAKHAPVYRSYLHTSNDPWYEEGVDGEDRHALLRGLFLTGFLADEFFADDHYFGVEQALVLSSSSKTAIGFAQRAAQRDGLAVIGVTSSSNVEFVRSLGYYDSVVTYDELTSVEQVPSVLIDMSGNKAVVAELHRHLDEEIRYSMALGRSHHDSAPAKVIGGPRQQMFFAPTEVSRRLEEWGRTTYEERTTAALREFVRGSLDWMSVQRTHGPEDGARTWTEVRSGDVQPSTGRIVSMHEAAAD